MSGSERVSPDVRAVIEAAGYVLQESRSGDPAGFEVTNQTDVTLRVQSADEGLEVLREERGDDPYPVMRAASFEDVERFLVTTVGAVARSHQRLRRIVLPWRLGEEAAGFEVSDVGHWWFALVRSGASRSVAELPGDGYNEAVRFSHVASLGLADLAASYLHPAGTPALEEFVADAE